MRPLEVVRLPPLMERSSGRPEVSVALIDGPVALNHPDLAGATMRELPGTLSGTCSRPDSAACAHGTLVAGMLFARRGSVASAICPGCTFLLRPVFSEVLTGGSQVPSATADELAEAFVDAVDMGARIVNLSAALIHPTPTAEGRLQEALNYAARHGVITVAAAGNQRTVGSSAITRHPSVIAVAACNIRGIPLNDTNLGSSIGQRGLTAPGESITSLGTTGKLRTFGGSSAAAPFVTGTIALLWSEFPTSSPGEIKLAVLQARRPRHRTIVPTMLDAWGAYLAMASSHKGKRRS